MVDRSFSIPMEQKVNDGSFVRVPQREKSWPEKMLQKITAYASEQR